MSHDLPDFPWDKLTPFSHAAAAHPDGSCNLSVGTPVDPVPGIIRRALCEAANSPGYPTAHGSPRVRAAVADWFARTAGVADLDPNNVLSVLGTKEFIGGLPTYLGLGSDDLVVIPTTAYPTYDVGAQFAKCRRIAVDSLTALGGEVPSLIWLNSPSNPTGKVLPAQHLRKVVEWARERDVPVASDECYFELGWDAAAVSILHPDVCGDSHEGLLAVHSLSKRSNLAGYRYGYVAGDPRLIAQLLELRKHLGMMVPVPIQAAAVAALDDDAHVFAQRERYGARRKVLIAALIAAGFRIDHSEAGLYLWVTRDEPCWDTVGWLAERGILVAPGDFYGPTGAHHVRFALTATDERVATAAQRLHEGASNY